MRHYFLDTSALVKLYVSEPGSRRVRDMVRSARVSPHTVGVVVCDLAHPEAASALCALLDAPDAAKRGLGKLAARKLPGEVARDLWNGEAITVAQAEGLMATAADLVWKHRIRGADAVHIAAAIALKTSLPKGSELYFVGSDRHQNAAAAAESLAVLDPTV